MKYMQSMSFCLILSETSFLSKIVFILEVSLVTSSVGGWLFEMGVRFVKS